MSKSIRKKNGVFILSAFLLWRGYLPVMAENVQERITMRYSYLILEDKQAIPVEVDQPVFLQDILDENYALVNFKGYIGRIPRANLRYPAMYVYQDNLKLREEPIDGNVKDIIEKGSKVIVVSKEDGWAKVTYNGQIGYCSLSYLSNKHIIGSYSTQLSSNSNNINNIRVASNFINGKVIKAGTTFSYLDAIGGESTIELGYLPATVIVNGKKSTGLGGGVCQVSSTLYAAIKDISDSSLIKVIERYPHSIPVGYISQELEATVAYPTKDLKFIPLCDIEIESYIQEGRIYVNIIKK